MNLEKVVRILFIVCTIVANAASYIGNLPTSQTDVLLSLYSATNGPYWANKWSIDDPTSGPCDWYGIYYSPKNKNVLELNLQDNRLEGIAPASLGMLSTLESLYINDNHLLETIPASLGMLSNLTVLSLYDNQLSGTIPASLEKLSILEALYLNNNQLGSIPASLGNMSNLFHLYLQSNSVRKSSRYAIYAIAVF
jgi:Leucine-rich repeat (LRR) protein